MAYLLLNNGRSMLLHVMDAWLRMNEERNCKSETVLNLEAIYEEECINGRGYCVFYVYAYRELIFLAGKDGRYGKSRGSYIGPV